MQPIKNKHTVLIAAITVICIIGGVFAYWTQELIAHNEFKTAVYDTSISEDFVSPSDWLPGQEINKDVWVRNDSSIPVFVKVTIRQEWIRTDSVYDAAGNEIPPLKGEALPLTFDSDNGTQYAAQIKWGENVVKLQPISSFDLRSTGYRLRSNGSTGGLQEVDSIKDAEGKWLVLNETPDDNGEIQIIYIGSIDSDQETPLLLDSVTMNPEIQQTVLRKDTKYNKETGKWETVSTINSQAGYECARYTMTVTAQTVQATTEAALEVFGNEYEEIISALEPYTVDQREVPPKTLSFEKRNGKMVWSSKDESGENWFMSFTNMVPGESCSDMLEIKNKSKKTYDLYMQFTPVDQSELQDELLERISMKVMFDGEVIYEGTASGKNYQNGVGNLRNVIKLCRCEPGKASSIKIQLSLDKSIDVEYADLLSRIDCRFMVTEINKPPQDIQPKTGDELPIAILLAILVAAAAAVIMILRTRRISKGI